MKNKIEVFWGKTAVGTSRGCYLESMWWEEKVQEKGGTYGTSGYKRVGDETTLDKDVIHK